MERLIALFACVELKMAVMWKTKQVEKLKHLLPSGLTKFVQERKCHGRTPSANCDYYLHSDHVNTESELTKSQYTSILGG